MANPANAPGPEFGGNPAPARYQAAVNRAIDYVLNSLDRRPDLGEVAEQAGFSPHHFHRIFRSLVGETLHAFVQRLRLERALALLSHGSPRSWTEIAHECGFSSSSDFSRAFKQRYGTPPSRFDLQTFRDAHRERWAEAVADPHERHRLERLPPGENPDGFEVRLRQLPPRTVAYRRVFDPYRPTAVPNAAKELVAWARSRGLEKGDWLGYMWDDPEIVDPKLCRYDVGLVLPPNPPAQDPRDETGRRTFPAMKVAELEIRGTIDLELRALDWLYGTWLPASGFVPADLPALEAWIGLPFAHGLEHFELRAQLPVVRQDARIASSSDSDRPI